MVEVTCKSRLYERNNTEAATVVTGRIIINNNHVNNNSFELRATCFSKWLKIPSGVKSAVRVFGYVNEVVVVDDPRRLYDPDNNNNNNNNNKKNCGWSNVARSDRYDKSELSWKVIADRQVVVVAPEDSSGCETERSDDDPHYNEYRNNIINSYEEEINALDGGRNCTSYKVNNRFVKCATRGLLILPLSELLTNEQRTVMIGEAYSISENNKSVSGRNADKFTLGYNNEGYEIVGQVVTVTPGTKTYRVVHGDKSPEKKGERGHIKMSMNEDRRRNSTSSTGYKGSNVRTSRSAESTPEAGGCCRTIVERSAETCRPRCKLNENNCLSLSDILRSFNGPISEEQAWALCYQCAKCFRNALHSHNRPPGDAPPRLYDVTELAHVQLHKDGEVHSTTIREPPASTDSREPFTSEHKLVFSLGLIVFGALDFGLDEEEERRVAPDLEALITLMTQPEDDSEVEERLQETDDEGIERDSGESEDDPLHQTPDGHHPPGYNNIRRISPPPRARPPAPCSVNTVLQLCTRHLQGSQEQADTHYKAVVRALVAEALELSHFLEKVAADKQGNSISAAGLTPGEHHLDTLDFSDWARFWVQVIAELRRGVKLKKVDGSIGAGTGGTSPGTLGAKRVRGTGRGIEFELTPYEILMDDIRARRYRLRKTPSPSPHLRKDAHAVILDFIRSRPPLKKASERKLPPLNRQSTPRELLMESIKRPPRPLRPSSSNKTIPSSTTPCTTPTRYGTASRGSGNGREDGAPGNAELVTTPKSSRRESADPTVAPRYQPRRLIIPLDFKLDGEDDDDEDDDDDVVTRFDDDANSDSWRDDGDEDEVEGTEKARAGESANPWRRTGGLRLTRNEYHRFCDTQLESYDLATQCPSRRVSSRRHTVVGATGAGLGSGAGTLSLPHSRPHSRQHDPVRDRNDPPKPKDRGHLLDPELPSSVNSSQDELAREKSPNKGNSSIGNMFLDDRLSLTLEEIVHIRSVLTKAELESLPVEGRVKEDVEKRRVCFLCLKTRFGILGPWGQRCRLCERTVCVKCYSKMRIPTEHFAHVPVVLLSPSLMLSPPSEVDGKDYSSPSHGAVRSLWPRPAGGVGSAPASPASKRRDPSLRNTTPTPTPTPSSIQPDEGNAAGNSPAAGSAQNSDKSRRFYCSSANSSPARGSSRYGGGDLRVAERLRGVAMVVCHDCRIMVLQIIKSSRTTRATIRNNVISRLTLNLSPIYV